MFGWRSRPPDAVAQAVSALRRTLELVESSKDAAYSPDTAEEIAWYLRRWIDALESGGMPDRSLLNELFLPTGPIQETSHVNGWGDEFLKLAGAIDSYLGEPK